MDGTLGTGNLKRGWRARNRDVYVIDIVGSSNIEVIVKSLGPCSQHIEGSLSKIPTPKIAPPAASSL